MADRVELKKAVREEFGANMRSLKGDVVYVGSQEHDLSSEEVRGTVYIGSGITQLRNPDLLLPLFVEMKQSEQWRDSDVEVIWENLAQTLAQEHIDEVQNPTLREIAREHILLAIAQARDFLGEIQNNAGTNIESALRSKLGTICIGGTTLGVIAKCPAERLAEKWITTAITVFEMAEKSKTIG